MKPDKHMKNQWKTIIIFKQLFEITYKKNSAEAYTVLNTKAVVTVLVTEVLYYYLYNTYTVFYLF